MLLLYGCSGAVLVLFWCCSGSGAVLVLFWFWCCSGSGSVM